MTLEEFEGWLTPRAALSLVDEYYNNPAVAARAIEGRLKGGQIRVGCVLLGAGGPQVNFIPSIWKYFATGTTDWWDTGDVRFYLPSRYGSEREHRYYAIRFHPSDIATMVAGRSKPAEPQPAPIARTVATLGPEKPGQNPVILPPKSRARRPHKDFWDDLIIATCHAIWLGDLKPQTEAEIERWMLQWAQNNAEEGVSETSVKVPAKKVYDAFQD